jgi:uncharacterized protein (UPF0332 family)
MSPRSAEFFEAAKRRLKDARLVRDDDPGGTISLAYYAMFYAARAALSEHDTYAKTHTGTWNLFQQRFVDAGSFDAELLTEARKVQSEREDADYEAWAAPPEEAERVIELASSFLTAVEEMLADIEER